MKKVLLSLLLFPALSNAQMITTTAGTGAPTFGGDGGSAITAQLNRPASIAMDMAGNMYIADFSNNVIRKIDALGVISTIAGTGSAGYSGDGGSATAAELNGPNKVIADASGNLYIADNFNEAIRKINTSGVISTIAGTGSAGYGGDGGPAVSAQLSGPSGIALDNAGNLLIADFSNNRVRKVDASGTISTIAGTGTPGYSGDGAAASLAQFNAPTDVYVDASGNIYVSDGNNSCIRKINTSNVITTIAGTGAGGYNGDGIPAASAELYNPFGMVADPAGNIYIADQTNNRIRKVNTSGIISTIAGTGTGGYSGDGGVAVSAQLNIPSGICFSNIGELYIADQHNNRIRKIDACVSIITQQPINDTEAVGDTARFVVTTSSPASATYQWQENSGTGWVDLTNVLPYSGVNTNTLSINNVIMLFNNSHYRCIVSNAAYCTDTTSAGILIIHSGLGIQRLATTAIDIFPNPTNNDITIRIPGLNGNGHVALINEVGQTVMETTISATSNNIDLKKLPAGFYIARIEANGKILNKKIIKQ